MILSWNTTKACNLVCKHCYRDAGPDRRAPNELSTGEGKALIRSIAAAGFKRLIFSGGEPLLREDLFELTAFAADQGIIPVLGTNGTLITPETAKALKAAGVKGVGISLDSLQPDCHDDFRQCQGSWKKALEGIRNSLQEGLRVQINTTVTRHNVDHLIEITDFVSRLGVSAHHPFFLVQVGRGKEIEGDALDHGQYREIVRRIIDKQPHTHIELKPTCAPQFMVEAQERGIPMRFTRGCIAGISYCCILPDGDVHICPYLPVKVGNVRETPFEQLWGHSEIFKQLRDASSYKGACGACSHQPICGGCRARAYYATGDYMQQDPWCLKGAR